MNKTLVILSIALLAAGLLAACGDDNEDVDTGGNTTPDNENNTNEDDDNVINNENNDNENDIEENNNNADDNGDSAVGSGDYDDQENLGIGDTAQISSNTGEYEITLKNVEIMEEFEGEPSPLDLRVLADITLTNIGDESFDAGDTINILNISESEETSGLEQVFVDGVDVIEGELDPGDSISGEMLFNGDNSDTYYISVTSGLISSGAVHNNAVWTFEASEAE